MKRVRDDRARITSPSETAANPDPVPTKRRQSIILRRASVSSRSDVARRTSLELSALSVLDLCRCISNGDSEKTSAEKQQLAGLLQAALIHALDADFGAIANTLELLAEDNDASIRTRAHSLLAAAAATANITGLNPNYTPGKRKFLEQALAISFNGLSDSDPRVRKKVCGCRVLHTMSMSLPLSLGSLPRLTNAHAAFAYTVNKYAFKRWLHYKC